MTAQRTGSAQWRQTTVLIRTDIFERAQEEAIDISSTCNRALADQLGIDYRQQKIPVEQPVRPVIIAKEPAARTAGTGDGGQERRLRPVLNAEDPATPVHLLKMKKDPVPGARSVPATVREEGKKAEPQEPGSVPPAPVLNRQVPESGGKRSPQKKGKDDLIRQFLSRKILRTEAGEGEAPRIAKDEMYQLFRRYCRAKPGGVVPEKRAFSIALKNRFVMEESTADGIQYWNNVKLR